MAIAYNVIDPARERNAAYPYLLWFGLLLYIPCTSIPRPQDSTFIK